jgi:hypothetical protein
MTPTRRPSESTSLLIGVVHRGALHQVQCMLCTETVPETISPTGTVAFRVPLP